MPTIVIFIFALALAGADVLRRWNSNEHELIVWFDLVLVAIAAGAAGLRVRLTKDGVEISPEDLKRATGRLQEAEKVKGTASDAGSLETVVEKARRHGRARILWVDDQPEGNLNEMLALMDLGFDITPVLTTDVALRFLSTNRFQIVVSDMGRDTPDAGIRLLEQVNARSRSVPVIIYRGRNDEYSERARKHGAYTVATRPAELVSAILSAASGGRGVRAQSAEAQLSPA